MAAWRSGQYLNCRSYGRACFESHHLCGDLPGSFIKNLDCYWPTSEAVIKSDLTLFELLDPTIVLGFWLTVGHTV